jgi:hypothetical protein
MRTPSRGWRRHDPRSSPGLNRAAPAELSRARKMIPTKSHPVVRSRRPSHRPDLLTARRRAQRQSRMAEGHREAAPRVLDGREHDGSLAAEGRRPITRHIAVYPRNLTAANMAAPVAGDPQEPTRKRGERLSQRFGARWQRVVAVASPVSRRDRLTGSRFGSHCPARRDLARSGRPSGAGFRVWSAFCARARCFRAIMNRVS